MRSFIIDKGTDNLYYFKLASSTGEIIFTSEKYYFKTTCKNGIDSVRANASNYLRYELGTTFDGKYYFKLKGPNGRIIGKSSILESSEKRNNFVEILKSTSPHANVIDQTHSTLMQAV